MNHYQSEKMQDYGDIPANRQVVVRFLDQAIRLELLLALLVLPLAFPHFLLFIPITVHPFTRLVPNAFLTSHTPLNLKEALAAFMAIQAVALWLVRSILAGRFHWVWTPLHLPLLLLAGIAGLTLLDTTAWRLRVRDYSLVLCYLGYIHLFLLYGRDRRFRKALFDLFLIVGGIFTVIVFAMDREWYFGPFRLEMADNRVSLFATIGHNISVASFLLILAIYLVGRTIHEHSWLKRMGLIIWALLCVFLVISAQTVGVWLAFILLIPIISGMILYALWCKGYRLQDFRVVRYAIISALMGLLAFTGLFFFNQYLERGRPGSSPIERLKMRTDPRVVLAGTRARLWMISIRLIRERFPLGVGFSGFKYIYADEQGRYFQDHPDTILQPTERHTDRVHNEYLQIWVELGAMGLLALLYALGLFVSMQLSLLRKTGLLARSKLGASVAFVAMTGTLLHVLTSFEFHVSTSALFFVLGLTWWTGEGRLGSVRSTSIGNLSRLTPLAILLSFMAILSAQGFSLFVGRHVVADVFFNVAEYFRTRDDGLSRAAEFYDLSRRLAPYRGQVIYHQGVVQFRLGERLLQQDKPQEAIRYFERAQELLDEALLTYRFKDIFFYRAKIRGILSFLTARPDYLEKAIDDFRKVIAIYYRDIPAYYELGKLLYSANRFEEAFEVWRAAQKQEYEFMREYHVKDAEYLIQLGRLDMAAEYYKSSIILSPRNPEYYKPLLELYERMGRYQEIVQVGRAYLDLFPNAFWMISTVAYFEMKLGDRDAVEQRLAHLLQVDEKDEEYYLALQSCYSLLGQELEGMALLENWWDINRDVPFRRIQFEVLNRLDEVYVKLDKQTERENLWLSVLEMQDPQLRVFFRTRSMNRLGQVYIAQGRIVEASRIFRDSALLMDEFNDFAYQASVDVLTLFDLPLLF